MRFEFETLDLKIHHSPPLDHLTKLVYLSRQACVMTYELSRKQGFTLVISLQNLIYSLKYRNIILYI